jgi:hypothetical protein
MLGSLLLLLLLWWCEDQLVLPNFALLFDSSVHEAAPEPTC